MSISEGIKIYNIKPLASNSVVAIAGESRVYYAERQKWCRYKDVLIKIAELNKRITELEAKCKKNPLDKVKMGKSRFEDANFRELYMSKVERPYLGEFPAHLCALEAGDKVSYWPMGSIIFTVIGPSPTDSNITLLDSDREEKRVHKANNKFIKKINTGAMGVSAENATKGFKSITGAGLSASDICSTITSAADERFYDDFEENDNDR